MRKPTQSPSHTQHGIEQSLDSLPFTGQAIFFNLHVLFWSIAVGTTILAWLGALVRAARATWANVEVMVEIVMEESEVEACWVLPRVKQQLLLPASR